MVRERRADGRARPCRKRSYHSARAPNATPTDEFARAGVSAHERYDHDDDRLRRRPSSATGASCTCTATGCSAPSRRPRTRCRRRSCARGARARRSTDDAGRRAWLYKIATNVCLDALRKQQAPVPAIESAEVPWLQPYPDRLLDEVAPSEQEPDAVVVARETIELTYIALIQLLPARQRAVLILRDVLDWSADETAELLDMSVAAANSALQRARATLRDELPERPSRARPS